ncbi:MAG: B12-binding domain-containing radical SAM protein [Tenericutes bacterium HGW-Tenericutes-5]|jgi:radical SAM superfamily enzyme YgiQ (UPF0313 family)|nr:MAG: B12-binding domain-containing radical SAM protein [Tenericutes bacterium HGW-Tenericutes-5]
MKILLVGINSKFIHPNLAIRYLKANCDYDVKILEYTIKDKFDDIIKDMKIDQYDIIGFSCYIWNIELITNILNHIEITFKNKTIILGGPEVSYDYDSYLLEKLAQFIITGEGELTFNSLVTAIDKKTDLSSIPNLSYIYKDEIIRTKTEQIKDLNILKSPYHFANDYHDIHNKIQYVELSRGCPYKCSYCLASLEKGLRFFEIKNVFTIIDHLVDKGAKTIKFLDRSFNANKTIALDFFKILIEKDYPNTVFQFEINGDVLHEDIIEYLKLNLKQNYIRFELGIQSTNPIVNKAIDRKQNTEQLINNIIKLQETNVILHLDLIAGLPHEDLESFKNTFNEIFLLFSPELQLGFLKMLKGTKIRKEAKIYDYKFQELSPYEITENKFISNEELKIIHKVETMLEIYWNRHFMNNTIKLILSNNSNPFDFFLKFYEYHENKNISFRNYQLSDLFINIKNFLLDMNLFNIKIDDSLKLDYLSYNKIKPKIYWEDKLNKQEILREFFVINNTYPIDLLYKYSLVTKYQLGYLIVIYLPNGKIIYYLSNNQTKRISL